MASSSQKNHAFIYDRKFSRNAHYNRSYNAYDSHAMIASSSSFMHGRNMPKKNVIHHMLRKNVIHVPRKMHNESATVFHACNTNFVLSCKNKKVVARKLGAKCKGNKTCIWVPKAIVTRDGNGYPKPETRNPMGFYPIRVRAWVNFHTHGFVNGHKCIPDGFMGTGLFL
jgi:hypothetical protein